MGWSTKIMTFNYLSFKEKIQIYCKESVLVFLNNFPDIVQIWNLMPEKIWSILDVA